VNDRPTGDEAAPEPQPPRGPKPQIYELRRATRGGSPRSTSVNGSRSATCSTTRLAARSRATWSVASLVRTTRRCSSWTGRASSRCWTRPGCCRHGSSRRTRSCQPNPRWVPATTRCPSGRSGAAPGRRRPRPARRPRARCHPSGLDRPRRRAPRGGDAPGGSAPRTRGGDRDRRGARPLDLVAARDLLVPRVLDRSGRAVVPGPDGVLPRPPRPRWTIPAPSRPGGGRSRSCA
jgi:hypothetical protein